MNPRCAFVFRSVLRAVLFSALLAIAVRGISAEQKLTVTNAGLVLWLKADTGITTDDNGFVQRWSDQSSHRNHAVQTNEDWRPKLVPDAFNGKPALHFNGVTNFLEIPHADSLAITGDLAIFAVVRVNDYTNLNGIIGKTVKNIPAPFDFYVRQETGSPFFFRGNGDRHSHLEGRSKVAPGQTSIVSAVMRDNRAIAYLNGAYNGAGFFWEPIHDGGRSVRIGSRDDFDAMLKGDLAEVIVIGGSVSESERAEIHNYLGDKYGISVTYPLNVAEQASVGRLEGQTAIFAVHADDPTLEFQWQKNGVDIPDATNALYATPVLTLADNNSHFRARVSAPGTNRHVGSVTLMVLPDTEPLTIAAPAFLLRDESRSSFAEGNSTVPPYNSRLWQTSDDTSRSTVQSVAQTLDGMLWIGTPGGLARFDGEQFEFVPVGSTNHSINALCAGADGSLWVGTAGGGAFQFRAGKWTQHPMPAELDANVLALRPLSDGSIWMGTRKGMALYQNEKLSLRNDKNDAAPGPEKSSATENVRSVAQDSSGDLWIAAGDHLMRLREGSVVADFPLHEFNPTYFRSVCSRRDGSVWVGANSGLLRFQDGKFTHFAKHNGLPDNVVMALFEDSRDNLWIGTSGGLCRFADGRFVVETTSDGEAYDQIWCVFEDCENNLWVGTKNALYQLRVQQFTTYTTRHGLAHNNVTSVSEDREGVMWIGTWGGGLHHLRDGKITIYSSAKNKTMRNDLILALEGARDGGVWFATDFDGSFYRLKNGQLTRYASEHGFGPTAARDLLEDAAGRLLLGTARESVFLLENGRASKYGGENTVLPKDVRCLLQGHDGRLWIGTESGLVSKTNATLSLFTTNDGLASNFVLSLFEDKEQTLWIGTAKGLGRIRNEKLKIKNEGKERFTFYSSAQGFIDDAILEVLEDEARNFWIATRRGVIRVSKSAFDDFDSGKISKISQTAFGKADGMSSPVCVGVAKPSACKSKDGRMWFATTKGLAVTDPKLHIGKNEKPPPVVIRKVLADKKGVVTSDNWPVTRNASDPVTRQLSSITLPPGRGELEFHYNALSYTFPEKNRFKYRLEGMDSDWVEAGTRRVAFYNSVPPGEYTFRVVACNNDGVWNSLGANVKLSLHPHYWQTKWFRGLMALAAIGFVASAARYVTKKRLQATLQRLEQQHAIEKERTRIAQDMHDELGARLTEIRVLSDLTEKKKDQPLEVEAQSRRISNAAGELIRNLHSIVWAVNPANDSLEKLADYICGFAQPFLKSASIRCRFERPDQLPDCRLSSEVRHNIVLVIKEALNNTIKHAGASEVRIALAVEKSKLKISLADNGQGFQSGNTSAFGNGLLNMETRITNIGGCYEILTEAGRGTTIRFEIPLKNVAAN